MNKKKYHPPKLYIEGGGAFFVKGQRVSRKWYVKHLMRQGMTKQQAEQEADNYTQHFVGGIPEPPGIGRMAERVERFVGLGLEK